MAHICKTENKCAGRVFFYHKHLNIRESLNFDLLSCSYKPVVGKG